MKFIEQWECVDNSSGMRADCPKFGFRVCDSNGFLVGHSMHSRDDAIRQAKLVAKRRGIRVRIVNRVVFPGSAIMREG